MLSNPLGYSNECGRLSGMKVIQSPYATEKRQFRFPRTQKKRIMKKWRKQERNYKHLPCMYINKIGGTLIVHPEIYNRLMKLSRIEEQVFSF